MAGVFSLSVMQVKSILEVSFGSADEDVLGLAVSAAEGTVVSDFSAVVVVFAVVVFFCEAVGFAAEVEAEVSVVCIEEVSVFSEAVSVSSSSLSEEVAAVSGITVVTSVTGTAVVVSVSGAAVPEEAFASDVLASELDCEAETLSDNTLSGSPMKIFPWKYRTQARTAAEHNTIGRKRAAPLNLSALLTLAALW